ncbi:hypothetical protein [Pseudonocardia sp. GCM10023141]|uniref:hypothetical protein n=1 Tax=Pseudonocardia sp. GCM10023141 TaxID=3252653 RepID=UPI00360C98B6
MEDTSDEAPQGEVLSVLRGIWTAQRQSVADIGPGTTKVCKNMKNIGFGGIADGGADRDSTAGPVDDDQRVAWRARLEREGKVVPGSSTLRDLLLGDQLLGDHVPGRDAGQAPDPGSGP